MNCLAVAPLLLLAATTQASAQLSVAPVEALAGSIQTITYRLTVEDVIEPGGGVQLEFPVAYGETEAYFWSKPQVVYADAPGHVSATTSTGASLDLRTFGISGGILECTLRDAPLRNGDTIEIVYRGIVQSLSGNVEARFATRKSPRHAWTRRLDAPRITILPQQARTLIVTTPADIQKDEPFAVAVVLLDRFGNRASGYRGTIHLSSTDPMAILPIDKYMFTAADAGVHVFDDVRFRTTGFQKIIAIDLHPKQLTPATQSQSHYARVSADPPSLRRYFGDTHFHTGTGTRNRGFLALPRKGDINTLPTEAFQSLNSGGDHRGNFTDAAAAYRYARDVVRLDFASSAEHDAFLFDSLAWEESQAVTTSFNEPGRFTTFYAYEWTPGSIHHIVLYKDRGGTVFDRRSYPDLISLWSALDHQGRPAVTIPHVTWQFDDHIMWDEVNNTYRKLGEIYSLWNNRFLVQPDDQPQRFEIGVEDKWSYQYAWDRGHRIGVVGSTDNHLGRPGANNYTVYTLHTGGLAVVLAEENNRDDIWNAFQERRTYATTGTRMYMDLEIDGRHMGSEFETDKPPLISARAAGTNRLERVEVLKYSSGAYETIHVDRPGGETSVFEFRDEDFAGDSMYYLRVTQIPEYPGRPWSHSTKEMAWSSPIWVKFKY